MQQGILVTSATTAEIAPTITTTSWFGLAPDCGGAAKSMVIKAVWRVAIAGLAGGVGATVPVVADWVEEEVVVEDGDTADKVVTGNNIITLCSLVTH